jgi:hypothetical protein
MACGWLVTPIPAAAQPQDATHLNQRQAIGTLSNCSAELPPGQLCDVLTVFAQVTRSNQDDSPGQATFLDVVWQQGFETRGFVTTDQASVFIAPNLRSGRAEINDARLQNCDPSGCGPTGETITLDVTWQGTDEMAFNQQHVNWQSQFGFFLLGSTREERIAEVHGMVNGVPMAGHPNAFNALLLHAERSRFEVGIARAGVGRAHLNGNPGGPTALQVADQFAEALVTDCTDALTPGSQCVAASAFAYHATTTDDPSFFEALSVRLFVVQRLDTAPGWTLQPIADFLDESATVTPDPTLSSITAQGTVPEPGGGGPWPFDGPVEVQLTWTGTGERFGTHFVSIDNNGEDRRMVTFHGEFRTGESTGTLDGVPVGPPPPGFPTDGTGVSILPASMQVVFSSDRTT